MLPICTKEELLKKLRPGRRFYYLFRDREACVVKIVGPCIVRGRIAERDPNPAVRFRFDGHVNQMDAETLLETCVYTRRRQALYLRELEQNRLEARRGMVTVMMT